MPVVLACAGVYASQPCIWLATGGAPPLQLAAIGYLRLVGFIDAECGCYLTT